MNCTSTVAILVAILGLNARTHAQQTNTQFSPGADIPLRNWSAPAYWQPTHMPQNSEHDVSVMRDPALNPQVVLPTQPLVFVAMTPCRVIDTRAGAGFPSPFGPGSLQALAPRTFPIQSSTLCSIPSTSLAYSFNVTVTPITTPGINPPGYLGFLTIYPAGPSPNQPPNASTLNNYFGTVVSNAAIVPAGDNGGSISAFAEEATNLIVDINGYYIQGSGGSSQWTTNGLNIFYNTGNVGVGTSTPGQKLDVAGAGRFTGGIMFGDGTTQTTAASGSGAPSQWTPNGSNIYFNGGNVGIGTSTPGGTGGRLEVAGNIKISGTSNGIIFPDGTTQTTAVITSAANFNTGVGISALANTTGADNTAVGYQSLFDNGGTYNTATGFQALYSNSNGGSNVAIGYQALYKNTTGGGNVASGGTALYSNTTGGLNTAIGYQALGSNTIANNNTASGSGALFANITGSYNTANGSLALSVNTGGQNNVADGFKALFDNTDGSQNTALGVLALSNNTVGQNDTAVGYQALVNSTGSNNIGIGQSSGYNVTAGNNNIMFGNQGLNNDDHVIRIGDVQTKTFLAGIAGVNVSGVPVLVSSSGQLGVSSSSRRFKQDIQDMGHSTSNLMRLRPVTYRYKQPFEDGSKPIQYGLIAEEVAEVYPEMVARSDDGKIETVRYQMLDSMLLNEVQKQSATIAAQKEQIRSLQERLSRLESMLERMTSRESR